MGKKQSFNSITLVAHLRGIKAGFGVPGCKAPSGFITALTAHKSCNRCHLHDFFGITKRGVFHETEGSICRGINCSCISWCAIHNFSPFKGHSWIQTGLSVSQLKAGKACTTVWGGIWSWAPNCRKRSCPHKLRGVSSTYGWNARFCPSGPTTNNTTWLCRGD